MSEMDEDPARPPACPDSAGLSELASRLGRVEEQLAGFHQRSAHREAVIDQLNSAIDQLHEENQLLKAGLSRMVLEPVITDLIRLHDQLSQEARRQAGDGQDAKLAWSFVDDVAQTTGALRDRHVHRRAGRPVRPQPPSRARGGAQR